MPLNILISLNIHLPRIERIENNKINKINKINKNIYLPANGADISFFIVKKLFNI